jgi:hypothetical protein
MASLSGYFLSKKIFKKGLNLKINPKSKWEDKDQILNAMGFHHFHIGYLLEGESFSDRSGDTLIAKVNRKEMYVIGVYDHSVYWNSSVDISKERKRLWNDYENFYFRGKKTNSLRIGSLISTSGHPLHIHSLTQSYLYKIAQFENNLYQAEWIREKLQITATETINVDEFQWLLNFSDLYLFNKRKNLYLLIGEGFN